MPSSTFSFLTLLYFAVFSIVSARERRCFWKTMPSKPLVAALTADALTGTVLTFVGLPGLMPLPWWQTLAVFGCAMVSCLVVNDAVKVAMIKWRVPGCGEAGAGGSHGRHSAYLTPSAFAANRARSR